MSDSYQVIHTDSAPAAVGPYSQAIKSGNTVYLSGQIPLDPATGELVAGGIRERTEQVFDNLAAVAEAAGGTLANAVRITIYLTDMSQFGVINEVMQSRFDQPYPARASVGVSSLAKGADVEMDAILVVD